MSLLYKSFTKVVTKRRKEEGYYPSIFHYGGVISRFNIWYWEVFSEDQKHWNDLKTSKPVSKYMNRFIAKQILNQTYKDYAAEAASLLNDR